MRHDTDTVSDEVQRLWREIGGEDVPTLDGGEDAEPVKRTRVRKPTVASVIRQMQRAGVDIAGCEINRDGTVKVVSGKPVGGSDIMDDTASPDPKWN